MANIKIGDLVTLSDPISTDVLPIVDVSADTTNKISIEELLKNAAAGTANLPAFAFDADPNTGMYRSGADALAFSTGGTGRLFIDSSGNIKLTSNEYQSLAHKNYGYSSSYGATMVGAAGNNFGNVALAVDVSGISGGNFNGQNQVIFPASGGLVPNNAGNNFIGLFTRNSSDSLIVGPAVTSGLTSGPVTITSTSVGIGTSSPQDNLQVGADSNVHIGIANSGGIDSTSGINWRFGSAGTTYSKILSAASGAGATYLSFYTSSAEQMRIDSSGRVGIGNTAMSSFTANAADDLAVGSGSDHAGITVYSGTSSQGSVTFADGTSGNAAYRGAVEYYHSSDYLSFRTAGTAHRMIINSSGNVGIGTTAPSAELHVRDDDGSVNVNIHSGLATGYGTLQFINDNNKNAYVWQNGSSVSAFGGTNSLNIANYDGEITFSTSTSNTFNERMRIDGSGNVYIDSPNTQNFEGGVAIYPDGKVAAYTNNTVSGSDQRLYVYNGSTASYKASINSDGGAFFAGNVGIGESSPSHLLDVKYQATRYFQVQYGKLYSYYDDNALIDTLTLRNTGCAANGHGSKIHFIVGSTSSSNSSFISAQQESSAGNTNLVFGTNNTERMRINSSGDVSIGTTSILTQTAELRVYSSAACAQELVGSAGTYTCYSSGANSTSAVARGFIGTANQLVTSQSVNNFAIRAQDELLFASGGATERMRILSGGGLTFNGDTAQVNALNDYEEGTFVPAINRGTTSPTVAYNWQTGKYTKIGNMVLIYFDLEMSSNSGGSGRYFIDNLPFDTATGNTSGGYGSPQFRDSGAFNNDANKFSTSSYHYLDTIQLRYMDMASTNNEVDITVGTGRITGWSMYFTDS